MVFVIHGDVLRKSLYRLLMFLIVFAYEILILHVGGALQLKHIFLLILFVTLIFQDVLTSQANVKQSIKTEIEIP